MYLSSDPLESLHSGNTQARGTAFTYKHETHPETLTRLIAEVAELYGPINASRLACTGIIQYVDSDIEVQPRNR